MRRNDGFGVALALEQNLEGNQWIDLKNSKPVDSAIAALPRDHHLREYGFSEQALGESLKACRRQRQHRLQDLVPIVLGNGSCSFGDLFCDGFRLLPELALLLKNLHPLQERLARLVCGKRRLETLLGQAPYAVLRRVDQAFSNKVEARPRNLIPKPRPPRGQRLVQDFVRNTQIVRDPIYCLVCLR